MTNEMFIGNDGEVYRSGAEPVLIQTSDETMLNAVVADGASEPVDVSSFSKLTFHIIAADITSGGTMTLSHSLDGTNYYDFATKVVIANGTTEVIVENQKYKYVKSTLSSRVDGTYTTLMLAGN